MINRMIGSFVLSILITAAILTGGEFSDTHDAEIDRLLKKLNKPALKSIKSPDGDIIDCVHLKNHPIYDHPLFKNHTIQMRPSSYPEERNNESSDIENHSMVTQLWTINGKCPKNSIPIRRTKREDILRVGSIERYLRKYPNNSKNNAIHEYAQLKVNGHFHGAQGEINVWKPFVEPREFSLAQMWLVSGPFSEVNSIEFGWQVYPEHYGDDSPRYFIYWTADGYRHTGCYNLECPGFVAIDPAFVLGGAVNHISTLDGQQYQIPTAIWKDPHSGNWWLKLNHHVFVGYWPSMLFNHLQNGAAEIHWGGEIVDFKDDSQHTTTTMGSGRFAEEGFKKASYFKYLRVYDELDNLKPIEGSYSYITKERCYNVRSGRAIAWGDYFFFGGPGRNPECII